MNYKANARYFQPLNWKLPAILILIGLAAIGASPVVGLAFLLAGGGWLFYQFQNKVSDDDLDAALTSQLANVQDRALNKLNLDLGEVSTAKPLTITGYNYERFEKAKRGKDGDWRTSDGKAVVIFFDEHQLYSYQYGFSLINARKNSTEGTDEYYYRDVVSVSTATATWRPPGGAEETFEVFKLTTSGGTSVSCSIMGESAMNSLKGARTLINDKKRGA